MSEEVNKFAKTAIKQFGMSELSAKKFASTYMAMSNSLGAGGELGKNMALNLTGLVGDIASFYNITLEEANTAISAVYTGETESIKKLGIVLTEANLNAFAVSQGLKKTYNQMSQAEKVMLRYNYVMKASANIQGDFVRTGGNWANQVRILKEQWSQLLSILGKGLITVLKPVVVVLNEMLGSLIAVANALSRTFGGKGIESASGSVSSTFGDMADGAGDVSTGLDDANSSAKALAKTVAGFDEINTLVSQPSGSGGTGIGGDITGSGEITDTPEAVSNISKISGYLKECQAILEKWVATIPKLEINFNKDKAIADLKEIGLNVLNTIAGWGTFVISLGIEVANDLDIGKLSNSFLNLLRSATGLASTITDALVPALQTFYRESGLKDIVIWIGEKFAEGMDGLAGKLDEWAQWFKDNKKNIVDFAGRLGEAVEPVAQLVIEIADVAWKVFAGILNTINEALKGIVESLINMNVGELRVLLITMTAIGGTFGMLQKGLALIGTSFLKAIFSCKSFSDFLLIFKEGFANFFEHVGYRGQIFGVKFATIFNNLKAYLAGFGTLFQAGFNSVAQSSALVLQSGTKLQQFTTLLSAGFKGLWTVIKAHPIGAIITAVIACIGAVADLYKQSEDFRNFVKDLWDNTIKPVFKEVRDAVNEMWKKHLEPLWKNQLKPLFKSMGDAFTGMWNTIKTVVGWVVGILGGAFLSGFVSAFGQVLKTVTEVIGGVADILNGIMMFISGDFVGGIKKAFEGLGTALSAIMKNMANMGIGFINGLISAIVTGINTAIKAIKKLNFTVPDWVPGIGGDTWSFSFLKTMTAPQIPYLANGGVITQPTMAMMGEYAGAYNNPEIVTPQSLLQEIIYASNSNIVDALIQQTRQLLVGLEQMNMEVCIGDDVIAQSAQRGNQAYKRRTGRPLFV